MENESRYYTVSEYSERFNIAEGYVRAMIKSETLPDGHKAVKLSDGPNAQVRIWVGGDNSFKVQQLEKENKQLKEKMLQIGNILLVAN